MLLLLLLPPQLPLLLLLPLLQHFPSLLHLHKVSLSILGICMQDAEDLNNVREHLGKFSLSPHPSLPLSRSHTRSRTCVYLPTVLPMHSSAVTGTADRGCCRTVEALEPILCQVVLSLASHWHISFSSLFSRLSSALPIAPHLCISLPPQPCLLLWD